MTAPQLTQYIQGQGSVSADGLNTFMQTTNLIADLRAFVGVPGIEVAVRGQTVINDGGGGFYYWNSGGTGPDDGFNTIVPFGAATGVWTRIVGAGSAPQSTAILSGAGTYVTPIGAKGLWVRLIGGGGGGGGVNVGAFGNDGANGTPTVFGGTTANNGLGSNQYSVRPGGSGGTGPSTLRLVGGQGQGGLNNSLVSGLNGLELTGTIGGNSPFGGTGSGGTNSAGGSAAPNSGSGGGGASYTDPSVTPTHGTVVNGSGSAGEYVELMINGPAATYTYSIGPGGTGGTGAANNGGNGGSGIIIVQAFF